MSPSRERAASAGQSLEPRSLDRYARHGSSRNLGRFDCFPFGMDAVTRALRRHRQNPPFMNLLLRLCLTFLLSRRRQRLHVLDTCVTPFRVWPNDLDVLRHMTNGRYFAILDLGRVDLLLRSRVWQRVNAQRWYPVVTLETIRFHRSLQLCERYDVTTRVIGWDEKHVFLEQGFSRGGTKVALGVVRTRFLKRGGGTVPTNELLAWIGVTQPSPDLPEWVVQWSRAEGGMAVRAESVLQT
ncbi:thioesterase family protein [Burkholderia pyrrocinia]|uniref:thioesterase family protein n=1 Tax=Burkholderia pyrrocinia TaxID=60550 RepID=UPI0038B5237C